MQPYELTATETVAAVRAGDVSRREVAASHLERLAAVNPAINAIVEPRDPDAVLAEASAADDAASERRGLPLDGVVVSIKDHHDVAGMHNTEAVRAFADRISPADSLAVARLRAAGANVIGKANQPDFAIRWNSVSDLNGTTRNPRDLSRSAGGSSGGDAATVAAGMAALGLGGDYGGSIRVPASFCGIWGLRPSAGRVPHVPGIGPPKAGPSLDLMMSLGPLARSLDDLVLTAGVLCGADPADPASVPVPLGDPDPGAPLPRVARLCGETGAIVDPAIEAELDRVCGILAGAGYGVDAGGFPNAERAPELWGAIAGTELLRNAMPVWDPMIGASGADHIRKMFGIWDLGPGVAEYLDAFIERGELARSTAVWMEDHPLVVAPLNGMPTPLLDFDEFISLDETRALFDRMRSVVWVNLLSLPAVALPNGIQIVARRFHEHEAFAAAAVVAEALGRVEVAVVEA